MIQNILAQLQDIVFLKKVVILLLLFNTTVQAQQQVFVSGIVRDAETGQGINNANISLQNSSKGAISDENGFFAIKLNKKQAQVLMISHVAYEYQTVTFNKELLAKKDTIKLELHLDPKALQMKGFSIVAERVYMIQDEIFDFEINDSLVFVLGNYSGKAILKVYTFYDSPVYQQFVPYGCNKVFYDFSNRLSIGNQDWHTYYSLNFNDNLSSLKKHDYDSIEEIARSLYPYLKNYISSLRINPKFQPEYITIVDNNSHYIYYTISGRYFPASYKVLFRSGKNGKKTDIIYLHIIGLEFLLNKNYYGIKTNQIFNLQDFVPLYFSKLSRDLLLTLDNCERARIFSEDFEDKRTMVSSFYLNSMHAPVFFGKIKNSLHIFNFHSGIIYQLDSCGRLVNVMVADSNFQESRCKNLFINREQTRAYARYERFGRVSLKEMDLATGKYLKTIVLTHSFVDKIRVVNNEIYYIYKNFTSKQRYKKYLYKQRIE